ncbi:MAG: hypothetical protein J0M33_06825 [Anaerolineae bacterium]|nr:hypothetical protein [Anaerolineae bacterium]
MGYLQWGIRVSGRHVPVMTVALDDNPPGQGGQPTPHIAADLIPIYNT